ncbi:hypothetical protein BGW37DRAFT_522888 [Umbelopsis sp. PMI_123]|nr:hypothetical protein BGW37DRAFT_522888 [Umbelopsis sp. PMI_123]
MVKDWKHHRLKSHPSFQRTKLDGPNATRRKSAPFHQVWRFGILRQLGAFERENNKVDGLVGILSEDPLPGHFASETAGSSANYVFEKKRDGDRFYYQNELQYGSWLKEYVQGVTMKVLLERNTGLTNLPDNVFLTPTQSENKIKSNNHYCQSLQKCPFHQRKTIFNPATGWTIIECIDEADVHIGSLTLTDEDVVVSGDSDMLFYDSVQHVLRPVAKMVYHYYSKTDITTLLNLISLQWTSVGIVSGNDYDPNVWGYGIARNCKLIRSISATTVAGIIKEYLEKIERNSLAEKLYLILF